MAFDEAAVDTLIDKVASFAAASGYFEQVNQHEPKSSPGNGLTAAVWFRDITPIGGISGLAATSGRVTLMVRIYANMIQEPQDEIDPDAVKAFTALINAFSSDFDFGETVRNVDLLGAYDVALGGTTGYQKVGDTMYRVLDITVPVLFNDMWSQSS